MRAEFTSLPGVIVIEPKVFGDSRGHFFESFNERTFAELTGMSGKFVQDNQSRSARHVLRGLHYQIRQPQAKLVRVICGEIFDVAIDIRKSSPTFGGWTGVTLSSDNKKQLWIPEGFAHGFVVTSDIAEVVYKCTSYWAPEHERSILWNDPAIGIAWPLDGEPTLSTKDKAASLFHDAEVFE